jgi:hypothetical protein
MWASSSITWIGFSRSPLDLLARLALGEVDRERADLLGLGETLRDAVDDIHLGGAAQARAVGST